MSAQPKPFKDEFPGYVAEPMTNEQRAEETPKTPGYNYAYMDKTRQVWEGPHMQTEANHAILNPAFYPKDHKPEALWGEAEKAGAEFPPRLIAHDQAQDPAANSDPAAAVVPLGPGESAESTSEEAVQARTEQYEQLAKKDLDNEEPVAKPEDTVPPAEEAEENQASAGKVRRRRTS